MCCQETRTLGLPAVVIEAQARYRRLLEERGWDWGGEQLPDFFRWARFSLLGPLFDEFAATGDWAKAIRAVIGDDVPPAFVVVHIDEAGGLHADVGEARPAIAGHTVPIDVVVDSAVDVEVSLRVAGHDVPVAARGAAIETIDLDGADPVFDVVLDEEALRVDGAARTTEASQLRLSSRHCSRWSVTDSTGGAWFPEGVLEKWDFHHRPYFHGHDVTLAVPAEPLHVVCARGIEFDRMEMDVHPASDEMRIVECDPQRLFDPAEDGWYGGDLHVHMNYSGDLVCAPGDAARMQFGEGLHLVNLVAANFSTSLVYDRDLLEQSAGTDLPWSNGETVARMGVEYRNDLLGHVHALGPSSPPSHYYSGHERSDHPEDWPPNRVACEEMQSLGATIGYAHPAFTPFPEDWSTSRFFQTPRSAEARELVADAALGVVDSIDLISPFDDEGAVFLYHRLLSCGLRLAATAGTDVFLSFSHGPGVASNPPGWGRVYAHLGPHDLSVEAFKEAIRRGNTMITNGPWLTFEVNGRGPGTVLDSSAGDRLDVRAHCLGPGAEHLSLVGPDGVLTECSAASEVRFETTVDEPTWIAAVARGASHPNTLDESVLAHTSPVYVDVSGRRVGRVADATWCLEFLDTLERFVDEHGHFDPRTRTSRLGDLVAVLDEARSFYRRVAETAGR